MSYQKFYPNGWQSGETGGTPITPEALSHIEAGIEQVYDSVAPAVESEQYPGCYYRTVNGVVEWINPPMLPGIEYRTTERWDGKAVCRKLVQYTNDTELSGNALYSIPHGITNWDGSYGALIQCRTASFLIPYVAAGEITAVTACKTTAINLTTTGNTRWAANRTWYFDMKYVKKG